VVRVLVVDDQQIYRRAMTEVVAATPGFELVGEAESGDSALADADELSPQLVVMDKRMPGMNGHEATRRLAERHPGLVIVIVSVEDPDPDAARAAGAATAVHKRDLAPEILQQVWDEHRRFAPPDPS
jgi:two-component system, NarL family, invasion response regulator UvrY